MRSLLIAGLVLSMTTSCGDESRPGSAPGKDGAQDAAAAWYRAIAESDSEVACGLMTTSMHVKMMSTAQATTCEDGVDLYAASLDQPTKELMKAESFILTLNGDDVAYVKLNSPHDVPTFEESWANARWWISGIVE